MGWTMTRPRSLSILALPWILCVAGASAQTRVRLPPERSAADPEPTRPASVGTLGPPASLDLDEGPVSAHGKVLTWIGFHQAKSYSRVFLKTTERAEVDVHPGRGNVVVRLRQTRARLRNNLRLLDTSYFPSAVWRIVPRRAGKDLMVEIEMREAVSYRVRRRAETILIDFDLPGQK